MKYNQAIRVRPPINTRLHEQVRFKNRILSKRPAEKGTQSKSAGEPKAKYPLQFRPVALTHIRVAFCRFRISVRSALSRICFIFRAARRAICPACLADRRRRGRRRPQAGIGRRSYRRLQTPREFRLLASRVPPVADSQLDAAWGTRRPGVKAESHQWVNQGNSFPGRHCAETAV